MGASKGTSRFSRTISLSLALTALAVAALIAPALGLAEDCGYSACHNGRPIPGTETSQTPAAVETTCVPGKPSLAGKARVRRKVKISGTLKPAPAKATKVTVYYQRQARKRFRAWSQATASVAASATAYTVRTKFSKRGVWRARAVHVLANGHRSVSAWRTFRVR